MVLLKHYYVKTEEWESLEILLPQLEKNNLIEQKELEALKVRCLKEKIRGLSDEILCGNDWISKKALLSIWKKAPAGLTTNVELIRFYVNVLIKIGDNSEALKVVEQIISKERSDQLVLFYGEKDFKESARQLATAERWLKTIKDSNVLFLTLARISLKNELMEKAKNYYELSMASSPSAEAYLELSLLSATLGDDKASLEKLKL